MAHGMGAAVGVIAMDQVVFNSACDALSSAVKDLSGEVQMGDITSKMTVLSSYRDEMSQLSELVEVYKNLLTRDLGLIKKARLTLSAADRAGRMP